MQARAALEQAVKAVLKAPSAGERQVAAAEVAEALVGYLDSADVPVNAEGLQGLAGAAERAAALLGARPAPYATMDDASLEAFNELLPWAALTVDPAGRIVGSAWSGQKRNGVAPLVDPRLHAFDEVYPLKGRTALEVGCFEGIHTMGLCLLGAQVTGADARVENLLKTMARAWLYGERPQVMLWDLEKPAPANAPEAWDMLHHIGVLYHLSNPVEHLQEVLPRTRGAMLLDTHVANDEGQATKSYQVGGRTYRYRHKEEPYADTSPFAGMRDHAKYLLIDDLLEVVRGCGFADVRLVDDRAERNGRRVTVWAFREKR